MARRRNDHFLSGKVADEARTRGEYDRGPVPAHISEQNGPNRAYRRAFKRSAKAKVTPAAVNQPYRKPGN